MCWKKRPYKKKRCWCCGSINHLKIDCPVHKEKQLLLWVEELEKRITQIILKNRAKREERKKKTITLALAPLLCAALAACSGSAVPSATETEAAPATTAAPAVTDAPATLITPTEASTAPEAQNTADNSSDPDRLIVNEVKLASIEKNDTFPVKFTSYNYILRCN